MKLNELRPAKGAVKPRKRVGRGESSGTGGTSGKGHKGHKARSGGGSHLWSEGGQMPLQRRIPKGGFKNVNRIEYQVVNVGDLNRFEPGTEVTLALLKESCLAKKLSVPVKILGNGALDRAVRVRVHAASASAREKIEAAGGSLELLEKKPEA
jgi:large subunit ribosomal protein L15